MDFTDEDVDRLNEETFECAEAGDWELDHEEFAIKQNYDEPIAPDANQLPRFWETSTDYSLLWSSEFSLPCENTVDDELDERGVDVEDFLQRLVTDDAFEDPAILDISRKVAHQKLSGSALDNILGAPAYPSAPTNLLDQSHDIWKSCDLKFLRASGESPTTMKDQTSLNLKTLLKLASESTNNKRDGTTIPMSMTSADLATYSIESKHKGGRIDDPPVASQTTTPMYALNNGTFMQKISNLATSKPSHLSHNVPRAPSNAVNKFTNSTSTQYPFTAGLHPTSVPPPVHLFQNLPPPGLVSMLCRRPPPPQYIVHPVGIAPATAACTSRWPAPILFMSPNRGPPPPSPYYLGMQRLLSLGRSPPPGHFLPSPLPGPPTTNAIVSALPANRIPNAFGQLAPDGCLSVVNAQDEFDPNRGTWMSEYETFCILMSFLRPLAITNPYVEDYYFAVQWLRRLAVTRLVPQQQLCTAVGVSASAAPLPPIAMSVPSPVTPDRLANPNYYHNMSMQQKLVIPLSQFTASMWHSTTRALDAAPVGDASDAASLPPKTDTAPHQNENQQEHQGLSTTLGRPVRPSLYRPRVVIDLSLSALTSEGCIASEESAHGVHVDESPPADLASVPLPLPSVKATRRRLLVLAWIERMFTLLLHICETELSLERIVVQNEMRSRLNHHRNDLVVQITREFVSSAGLANTVPKKVTQPDLEEEDSPSDKHIISTLCLLMSVRKGARLFAALLHYLPLKLKHKCLCGLLCGFTMIDSSCTSSLDELAPLIYPPLRHCIYQDRDINSLLADCFPDAYAPSWSGLSSVLHENAIRLLNSSVGSSLVFCLLDTCARFSSPADPSEFIRFGTYFTRLASTSTGLSDSTESPVIQNGSDGIAMAHPVPLDSFSHLASILPLYLSMSPNPCVSADEVLAFCRRTDKHSVPQPNVPIAVSNSSLSTVSLPVASVTALAANSNAVGFPLSEPSSGCSGNLPTPQSATVKV